MPCFYVMGSSACATAGRCSPDGHGIPKTGRRGRRSQSISGCWALGTQNVHHWRLLHRQTLAMHAPRPARARPKTNESGAIICQHETPGACSSALQNSVRQTAPETCRTFYSSCPRVQPQGWALGLAPGLTGQAYWASPEGPPEGKRAAANWRELRMWAYPNPNPDPPRCRQKHPGEVWLPWRAGWLMRAPGPGAARRA